MNDYNRPYDGSNTPFLKNFWKRLREAPPPIHRPRRRIVHHHALAHSLEEADIIASCLRVMCPKHRVRVTETRYLTEFQIDVFDFEGL